MHLAKVATYDGRVVDAFYVRDGVGRKLADDPEEIDRALRLRLESSPDAARDASRATAPKRSM